MEIVLRTNKGSGGASLGSPTHPERFRGPVGTFAHLGDCEGHENKAGVILDYSGLVLGLEK